MTKQVLIPLAQQCEEMEAVTLIDLLVRADIEVTTASLDENQVITGSRGVQLVAQTTLDEVLDKRFDMVLLPGGLPGSDYLKADARILTLLKNSVEAGCYVGAICAAPKVLAAAGVLDNKQATSFPGAISNESAPGLRYINAPVVEDGLVLTSRGPGTAMDFALTIIEKLVGGEICHSVEAGLQRP